MRRNAVVLLALSGLVQCVYYWPQLPEIMASNFGSSGTAGGYSSKGTYFLLTLGIGGLLTILFLILPWMMHRLPTSWISVPNRRWLEPPYREMAIESMASSLAQIAVSTLLFLLVVNQLVIQANLSPEPRLSSTFYWVLGGYSIGVLAWTVSFVRRYSRDPESVLGTRTDPKVQATRPS